MFLSIPTLAVFRILGRKGRIMLSVKQLLKEIRLHEYGEFLFDNYFVTVLIYFGVSSYYLHAFGMRYQTTSNNCA